MTSLHPQKHNIVDEEMSFTQVRLDSILPGCGKMDTTCTGLPFPSLKCSWGGCNSGNLQQSACKVGIKSPFTLIEVVVLARLDVCYNTVSIIRHTRQNIGEDIIKIAWIKQGRMGSRRLRQLLAESQIQNGEATSGSVQAVQI
jgi:hypothetical protein